MFKLVSARLAGPYVPNTALRPMLRPFWCNDSTAKQETVRSIRRLRSDFDKFGTVTSALKPRGIPHAQYFSRNEVQSHAKCCASVVVAFRCIDSPIRTLRRRADDRRSICKRSYNMLATDLRIVSSMPQSPNPFLPHANSSAITFAQYVIAVTEASSWFWQS